MCPGRGRNGVQGFNSLEEHEGAIPAIGAILLGVWPAGWDCGEMRAFALGCN